MFRRLVLFGIAVVASALVALIIPLALVARDVARAEQLQEAREQAQTLAVQWRQVDPTGADGLRELTSAAVLDDATVTLVDPGGTVVGPVVPEEAAGVVRRAQRRHRHRLHRGSRCRCRRATGWSWSRRRRRRWERGCCHARLR